MAGIKTSETVDVRYGAKVLFLCLASFNLGHTFGYLWLGILFVLFFGVIGILNGSRRKEFYKRPRYNKIFAYGALVPLALFWVVTPGVENGVSPALVFIPGIYLLYLAALQERSRGNGGYESFVFFDGMGALLLGLYTVPRGFLMVGVAGFLLALFAYSRRGTAPYKYLLFLLLVAFLGSLSYGGWLYWKKERLHYGAKMADDYYQRGRMMGFDPAVALGSFGSNYRSKYNNQVVLRLWDSLPPVYLKAASYEKYMAGVWKLPTIPAKQLYPAYYQIDYSVFELADSLTRGSVAQVWVQSTLDNFGFLFSPCGALGFAAKDVDSLSYFYGGMVQGLNGNGNRSDWYYFKCKGNCLVDSTSKNLADSLLKPNPSDLVVGERYYPLLDSVIEMMELSGSNPLPKMQHYFKENFTYSLQVPGLERWRGGSSLQNDPLTVFWRTRQGFCEYYATLSTLALRRLGIPARYVTGFAHPEVLDGLPYAVFRRKHSHAWVEVFVDGHWVIFDPTPPLTFSLGNEENWFEKKWEGLRGRSARLMHNLKEGQWRLAVDNFQNRSEYFLQSPLLYTILAALLLGLAFRKIYVICNSRHRRDSFASEKSQQWKLKLKNAEKTLAKFGFRRLPGETVGALLYRVEKENSSLEGKGEDAVKVLQDYEKCRWKK